MAKTRLQRSANARSRHDSKARLRHDDKPARGTTANTRSQPTDDAPSATPQPIPVQHGRDAFVR